MCRHIYICMYTHIYCYVYMYMYVYNIYVYIYLFTPNRLGHGTGFTGLSSGSRSMRLAPQSPEAAHEAAAVLSALLPGEVRVGILRLILGTPKTGRTAYRKSFKFLCASFLKNVPQKRSGINGFHAFSNTNTNVSTCRLMRRVMKLSLFF